MRWVENGEAFSTRYVLVTSLKNAASENKKAH